MSVPEFQANENGWTLDIPAGKNLTVNLAAGATMTVGGTIVGNTKGGRNLGTPTVRSGADAANLVIDPASTYVSLTKGSAGAYTLAAPGAANVGNQVTISCGSAYAHVITVTGLANGNTLTMTNTLGSTVRLLAISATVWAWLGGAATQSQVG